MRLKNQLYFTKIRNDRVRPESSDIVIMCFQTNN